MSDEKQKIAKRYLANDERLVVTFTVEYTAVNEKGNLTLPDRDTVKAEGSYRGKAIAITAKVAPNSGLFASPTDLKKAFATLELGELVGTGQRPAGFKAW